MSMEANAKVHILKYNEIYLYSKLLNDDSNTITFTANKADYGGGLYVDDATYSGTCANSSRRYCLFQVLAMYNTFFDFHLHLKLQAIHFLQNRAINWVHQFMEDCWTGVL